MARQGDWDLLKSNYRDEGIALALGAGVTARSGLPEWGTLLERIAQTCFGDDGPQHVQTLIAKHYSFPAIASILEAKCPKETFGEIIRTALYETFAFRNGCKLETYADKLIDETQRENLTLCAVAALCARRRSSPSKYKPNDKIHAIANTNFDALLQMYSRARYKRHMIRTIERASAGPSQRRINTYHLHGFFQFDRELVGDPREESIDERIFTEQEYFDFFDRPNSHFSYTFLFMLRRSPVLFIGMSLEDENIRRLLHYARKEIQEGYEREGVDPERARLKSIRHYTIRKLDTSQAFNDMIETSMLRLGLRVLWVEKWEELPSKLGEVYESVEGMRWSDVYTPVTDRSAVSAGTGQA